MVEKDVDRYLADIEREESEIREAIESSVVGDQEIRFFPTKRTWWTFELVDGWMNFFGAETIELLPGHHKIFCTLVVDDHITDIRILEFFAPAGLVCVGRAVWAGRLVCYLQEEGGSRVVCWSRALTKDEKRAYAETFRDNTDFSPFDEYFWGNGQDAASFGS